MRQIEFTTRSGVLITITKQEFEQLIKRITQLEEANNRLEERNKKLEEANNELKELNKRLEERNKELERRLKELEAQLHQNSRNSHKPPSSDGPRKPIKNNREPSGRKNGAQEGHEGKTLKMVENPDKVIRHRVRGKCSCGKNLEEVEVLRIERRQVFDLPEKLYEVTEHQVEVKRCRCGCIHEAECPVKGRTQYGEKLRALIVYMNQYGLLPYERLQEFGEDIFGLPFGGGTIEASLEECYEALEPTEQQIKERLLNSDVIHYDETGMRCENKTQWIHSTSNEQFTYYHIHSKRGKEAMDAIGILPRFTGISVHDRWASYDKYENCLHSYCNAHLLRELKFVHEELGKDWAAQMIRFLRLSLYLKKRNWLNPGTISQLMRRYEKITEGGIQEETSLIETDETKDIKRGRKRKSKSWRLLEVFMHHREKVLRFINNKDTPFDNNLAERDLRMVKLKQKISGCFRTHHGAEVFCRIRSYISTIRKQGYNVLDALEQALMGKPILIYKPC